MIPLKNALTLCVIWSVFLLIAMTTCSWGCGNTNFMYELLFFPASLADSLIIPYFPMPQTDNPIDARFLYAPIYVLSILVFTLIMAGFTS